MRLRTILLLSALLAVGRVAETAERATVGADSATAYILGCRKANGAFGPADQAYTDAAWNFPAIAALRLLGAEISQPEKILQHGLGQPGGHVGAGHWQFHHYHGIRQRLNSPLAMQATRVSLRHQGYQVRYYGSPFGTDAKTFFQSSGGLDPRDAEARELGFYNLSSLYYLLSGLSASGRSAENRDELVAFVQRRQAPDGGFVDVRQEDLAPRDTEAHVAHTFHALAALRLLGAAPPRPEACAKFLRASQLPDGAFGWHPDHALPGNGPDAYYTWAAVHALADLAARPADGAACVRWLNSLQNSDGGFGDCPGWRSRLYSTYYAVDALSVLAGSAQAGITSKQPPPATVTPIPEGRFQIFQGLNKVPLLQPADLAGLHARGLNLLALKSADFAAAGRLRAFIREQRLPMDVVLCPEAYPHRAVIPGGAVLDHLANVTLDPAWTEAQRGRWTTADDLGAKQLLWHDYRAQVIRPVRELGALIYPEQEFEMEHAYRAYDMTATGRDGYNAMLAGFNWAPRDFVRVFPWRERYVDRLVPVADADAHGDLAKWSPQLDHTRHLFIAERPTHEDFLKAAAAGRVVCAIVSTATSGPEVTLYGPPAAVAYCQRHQARWQWWPKRSGQQAPLN